MNKSDHDLFCKLCAPPHALNHLLPPTRNRASLRTRGHSYQLPEYSTDLHEKSYLIRSLWNSFYSFFLVLLLCTVRHSDFAFCVCCLMCVCRIYSHREADKRNRGPDLQNILRQSYDYLTIMPKLPVDLRRTSNLQNILRRARGFS